MLAVAGTLAAVLWIGAGCAAFLNGFHLSGSITAAPNLPLKTPKPNSVLLIVASNNGGVPVAVRQIINPDLPLKYSLNEDDLVLPGHAGDGPLTVSVTLTPHGTVGLVQPGDIRGRHRGTARAGDRHVDIVLDESQ
ncbi:MAG: hypothetical protein A2X36_11890 [Elusimicrobia bacterium GWA2_69_24]|nr:MAG: hypothetical protein A2X36_11890 [Elusimicrobia bacterium GWA2_69_24]HBL16327.1 hypothetical protein [Elusimicrobiota bacterium]